jgi:hypothetical protein
MKKYMKPKISVLKCGEIILMAGSVHNEYSGGQQLSKEWFDE